MSKRIKIGIIYGGQSSEHKVSIASAKSVIKILDREKYKIVPIKISKKGKWTGIKNPVNFLKNLDIVFPLIHGTTGEDGGLQGFLEFCNIPYVGAGIIDSALGMDKVIQKKLFQQEKLSVVDFICLMNGKNNFSIKDLKFPCFVKPARGGSSVGISKVHKANDFKDALNLAKKYDAKVIIETAVLENREFECAIIGNENIEVSVVGEVIASNEFYDYNAKYIDGKSQIIIPAKISKQLSDKIRNLALKAYQAINCNGMARVDFLYDTRKKKLYINEVNTIPGFTSMSMYSKLWEVSGLSYSKLLDKLVKLGFERYKQREKITMV